MLYFVETFIDIFILSFILKSKVAKSILYFNLNLNFAIRFKYYEAI